MKQNRDLAYADVRVGGGLLQVRQWHPASNIAMTLIAEERPLRLVYRRPTFARAQ